MTHRNVQPASTTARSQEKTLTAIRALIDRIAACRRARNCLTMRRQSLPSNWSESDSAQTWNRMLGRRVIRAKPNRPSNRSETDFRLPPLAGG